MLSFEEFQEEIGNESAWGVLRSAAGAVGRGLKRANKATDNFINEHVNVGKYGDMTTDEVGQAIKQGVQKGKQKVTQVAQQTGKKVADTTKQAAQKAVQTVIEHKDEIKENAQLLSKAFDKAETLLKQVPVVGTVAGPHMKVITSGVRVISEVVTELAEGNGVQATEKLTETLKNVYNSAKASDNILKGIANGLHDSTQKGKVEKARKKLKEIGMIAAKTLGIIGGSGAVAYVGYKGYQKVTGSNEDFYGLEDITESNYSEITELLTEVKHIIDTSTSTNDLYSKLQHLEKAKRKELQDVVYGRFTSLPDHKKVELNHLLVEISDGCRAKNITLEQAFSTSPWIWRAFKKTCTLIGATLKMIAGGTVILTTAATGAFAYKNRHLAKAMWKGMRNANSGLNILNTIVKR